MKHRYQTMLIGYGTGGAYFYIVKFRNDTQRSPYIYNECLNYTRHT